MSTPADRSDAMPEAETITTLQETYKFHLFDAERLVEIAFHHGRKVEAIEDGFVAIVLAERPAGASGAWFIIEKNTLKHL